MNIIAISGHLTADPELRSTQSGVPVASFRVGVRRKFSKDDKSDFFNVEAWRSNAEFVAKYFHKGKPIDIEGHLETGPWTDKNGSRHDGVKIVAWNAKKKSEADPSLTYTFPAGTSLNPGESLKIGNLDKLTNSQVGLRIYDAGNTLVQDVYLDAGWWNGACDEKGPHFIAKTFGAEAKTHSDWKPSETDFGANLRVLEMYTSTTDGGDTGEFIVLTNLDASAAIDLTDVKLVAWNSKKKSEADPSLVITLDAVTIPAGGTVDVKFYIPDSVMEALVIGWPEYGIHGLIAIPD